MTRAEMWWDAAVRALTALRASEDALLRDHPIALASVAARDADALLDEFALRETALGEES